MILNYTEKNSALNLLVLEIGKDSGAELFVKQFYFREKGKPDKTKYYEICYETLPGGKAVFSSTLNDYGFSGKPIVYNELVSISTLK